MPQFVTQIDGVDIHFIHVTSSHEDALPLIMTHGWPGSVIELLDTGGPLTDPTAYGGSAEDAFHLVLLPPRVRALGRADGDRLGSGPHRTGLGRADATSRLYPLRRSGRRRRCRRNRRDGARGTRGPHRHPHQPARARSGGTMPTDTDEERAAAAQIATFGKSGNGYFVEMATRPQTIGYALLDSPIALAAWMVDHDTDAYYKIARAFVDEQPSGNLTCDQVLDNITLYWLSGTGASAARSYWEAYGPTLRPRAVSLSHPRRSRSASRRSRARSGGRRAAGSMRATRTSSTSTRLTGAGTLLHGRSRNSSVRR